MQPDVDQSVLPEVCLSMEVAILDETRAGKKPKRSPAHEGTLLEVAILDETRAQGGKSSTVGSDFLYIRYPRQFAKSTPKT